MNMKKQPILPPHLKVVMERMFNTINIKLKEVDLTEYVTNDKYKWSAKQEATFKAWLAVYLYEVKPARREFLEHKTDLLRDCKKAAAEFMLNYGLICTDYTQVNQDQIFIQEISRLRKESRNPKKKTTIVPKKVTVRSKPRIASITTKFQDVIFNTYMSLISRFK